MSAADRTMADVTVVMPAYQAERTIVSALDSIAAQTAAPREVIVVDDGSTDGTVAAAFSCRSRMNGIRLRIFRQNHGGPGAARNRAIVEGTCAHIGFLDADDAWLPTKLERSLAVLGERKLDMVAHDIIEISDKGEHHIDCRARWLRAPGDPFRSLFVRGYISSSTVIVKRDAVLACGGFDPDLPSGQDYDLWLAILSDRRRRFEVFGEPLLRYHLHAAGITGRIAQRRACNLAILHRHIGGLQARPGLVLALILQRVAAIHAETALSYWRRGLWTASLACLAGAPWALIRAVAARFARHRPRPDFLARVPPANELAEP